MLKGIYKFLIILLVAIITFGTVFSDDEMSYQKNMYKTLDERAKKLFDLANSYQCSHRYGKAANLFLDCYLVNPLSEIGFHAMVMESYCLYMQKRYKSAIAAIDDIFELRSDKINSADYIYLEYLKILTRVQSYVSPDFCSVDIEIAKKESELFLQKYPASEYYAAIKLKILPFIINTIADKNLHIGRNCMNNSNYSGAIQRFLLVLHYSKNAFQPEAFYRLLECYFSLGLTDEMQDRFNKYSHLIDFGTDKELNTWYIKSFNLVFPIKKDLKVLKH